MAIQIAINWYRGTGDEGGRITRLVVYDVLGRQVTILVNENQLPVSYEARFDGSRLANGVYFSRMSSGSFVQARKMLLIK